MKPRFNLATAQVKILKRGSWKRDGLQPSSNTEKKISGLKYSCDPSDNPTIDFSAIEFS